MTTPISSSIPYATPADIREAHDVRQVYDTLNDDGTRVTATATQTAAEIFDSSSKVNKALMTASGMVEASCLRGNKYTVQDLQGLQGAQRYLLVDIVVELAWWKLYARRVSRQQLPPEALWAFSMLDALEKGEKMFGLQEQADAGNPHNDFMSSSDWQKLNLATRQARRYFGVRARERVNGADNCADPCGCD